jgi:excisionase family DNA binding protein
MIEVVASAIFPYFLNENQSLRWSRQMEIDVMTIRELADYLKLAEKTAYRLAAEGKIPGFKVGASWRFRKSEIDRWIVAQEKGQA